MKALVSPASASRKVPYPLRTISVTDPFKVVRRSQDKVVRPFSDPTAVDIHWDSGQEDQSLDENVEAGHLS
jgi:hypothetical protein